MTNTITLLKPTAEIYLSSIPSFDIQQKIERIGRICYKSEDNITDTSAKTFCQNLIKRGHESVLEHINVTAKIICDRGVSHELVRHRLCSFTQESTRYVNYNSRNSFQFVIPSWFDTVPPGEYHCDVNKQKIINADCGKYILEFEQNIAKPEYVWLLHCFITVDTYKSLIDVGQTPQQARCVLSNSLKTELVMTANLRQWRHIFKLRTAKNAHPDMQVVMLQLLSLFKGTIHGLFDNIADN